MVELGRVGAHLHYIRFAYIAVVATPCAGQWLMWCQDGSQNHCCCLQGLHSLQGWRQWRGQEACSRRRQGQGQDGSSGRGCRCSCCSAGGARHQRGGYQRCCSSLRCPGRHPEGCQEAAHAGRDDARRAVEGCHNIGAVVAATGAAVGCQGTVEGCCKGSSRMRAPVTWWYHWWATGAVLQRVVIPVRAQQCRPVVCCEEQSVWRHWRHCMLCTE